MKPILKILKLKGEDWENYFLALELMKNGSYKGLSVVNYDNIVGRPSRRKPTKAKQMFVPRSHISSHPSEMGWKEISASEIPANIQARFAEVA